MVAAVALLALFPAWAPAQTGGTSVPVTGGSWYWAEQVGSVNGPSGPVAPPPLPAPDVPAGDFPVAVVGGQTDKISFLLLDSSAITAGSTVSRLGLTMHEDNAGGNLGAAMATIEARGVTGFLASGDQGKPLANAPSYDTTGPAAPGKRAPDGTWTFDLTQIASGWASGQQANNGIALVPTAPVQGQTYEVVLGGLTNAKPPGTDGLFSPGSGDTAAPPGPGETAAPVDTGAPVAITPDLSSAGSGTSATPSFSGGDIPAGAATSRQQPSVAGGPTRVRQIGSTHRAPPWSFYLAVLAAIALIGASTLSLGEIGEPEPERRGGVLRTLERRTQEVPS